MTLTAFRKKWLGRSIGRWSTSTTPQCVDLCRQWMFEGWGWSEKKIYNAVPRVDAEDWFREADPKLVRKTRYEPGRKPPEGAIVVLRHGIYGHVFVAKAGCDKNLMRSLDQNWSVPSKITDEAHNYAECVGWLTKR